MSENVEVAAPAPVHDHPHVKTVFIPSWVVWSAAGVFLGVVGWAFWEAWDNQRRIHNASILVRSYAEGLKDMGLHPRVVSEPVQADEAKASDTVL